ncbi:MAG: Dabb family protein [Pirellulales bacterium]
MMKKLAWGCLIALVCAVLATPGDAAKPAAKGSQLGKLRHVVLFKFKDGTTPNEIKSVEDAFRALPSQIPTIKDFEWGTNISEENRSQGFTHCFLVTFDDVKGRAVYLPHPAHKAFGKVLGPFLDKVLVIDFIAKD